MQGTIEYAKAQVERYRAQLETRVLARFDKAEAKKDLTDMAACALIMDEFESAGGTSLVQVRLRCPTLAHQNGIGSCR